MGSWVKVPNTRCLVINGKIDLGSLSKWSYELNKMVDWHWGCDICGWDRCELDLRYYYCPCCGDKKSNPDETRMKHFSKDDYINGCG